MKPAPPVIMMFFTSGRGSNLVLPLRIGACFQMPKSSKKLGRLSFPLVWPLIPEVVTDQWLDHQPT